MKQEIWQGGVCEGLVVGSEEEKQRLYETYGEDHLEVDKRSLEEIQNATSKPRRWWQAPKNIWESRSEFTQILEILGEFFFQVIILSLAFYILIRTFFPWVG